MEVESGKVNGVYVEGVFLPFKKIVSTIPLPYIPELIPGLSDDLLRKYASVKNICSCVCNCQTEKAGHQ